MSIKKYNSITGNNWFITEYRQATLEEIGTVNDWKKDKVLHQREVKKLEKTLKKYRNE